MEMDILTVWRKVWAGTQGSVCNSLCVCVWDIASLMCNCASRGLKMLDLNFVKFMEQKVVADMELNSAAYKYRDLSAFICIIGY